MRRFDPWSLLPILKEIAVVLISAGAAAWAWFRTRLAYSWPSAQGTIMSAQVQSDGSPFQPWTANLTYSYTVNGEYYSGSHRLRARTRRRAEDKADGWKGRMIVVRYSPSQPDLSTVLRSDQPGGQLGN